MTTVNINTAKLAKEKAFNIPCEYYHRIPTMLHFREDEQVIRYFDSQKEKGNLDKVENNKFKAACINWNEREHQVSVPYQSDLQKWLREFHKIEIVVSICAAVNYSGYDYSVIDCNEKEAIWYNSLCVNNDEFVGTFKTYEDALEEALNIALNKIK